MGSLASTVHSTSFARSAASTRITSAPAASQRNVSEPPSRPEPLASIHQPVRLSAFVSASNTASAGDSNSAVPV